MSETLEQRLGVHWGLSLPNRGVVFGATTIEEILLMARRGEESGFFQSVWIGDSLLDRPRVEANVLMGALAAATSRLGIGVSCCASFILRHPIELAIQWASLDIISGGRMLFVPCLGGGMKRELDPFRVEAKERVGRLTEQLQLLRRFWTEPEVDHEGRYYRFDGVRVEPKPVQRPSPPLIYAVTPDDRRLSPERVDRALLRAVRYADGWQGADTDAAHLARLCRRVRQLADEERPGGAEFPCSTHVHVTIDDDRDRAWKASKWYFNEYYPEDFTTGQGPLPDELIRRFHSWGDAQTCAEGLGAYVAAGCSMVIVRFAAPDQQAQLNRFLLEVAPLLAT